MNNIFENTKKEKKKKLRLLTDRQIRERECSEVVVNMETCRKSNA